MLKPFKVLIFKNLKIRKIETFCQVVIKKDQKFPKLSNTKNFK